MTTLETISGATTACGSKFIQTTFSILSLFFFFFYQTKEFSISSLFSTQTKHNEEKLKSLLSSLPHITWGEFCPFFLNTIKKLHVPFLKNKENLLQKRDLREVFYFEKHPKTKIYWL